MIGINITSKSIGHKIYDKNKRLLGEIKEIIISLRGSYLEIENEKTTKKYLLNVNHIRSCGDYGYDADIDIRTIGK